MPSFVELLGIKPYSVINGEVVTQNADGFYQVRVGERFLRVRSALGSEVPAGRGVIIARTSNGSYIVGTLSARSHIVKDIMISG